jgi:hypothetical protein
VSIKHHSIRYILVVLLPLFLTSEVLATPQKDKPAPKQMSARELRELVKKGAKPPSGASFYIAPLDADPNRFSVLIQDADGRAVADTFLRSQILLLEDILLEARKFADTEEAIGKTSRFAADEDRSFIVDVQKSTTQSHFYFSIHCPLGKLTVDVGAIRRGDKNPPEILFTTMITRVQAAKIGAEQPHQ